MAIINITVDQLFDESSVTDIATSIDTHINAGDTLIITSSNGDSVSVFNENDWDNYKRGRSLSEYAQEFLILKYGFVEADFDVDIDDVSNGSNEYQDRKRRIVSISGVNLFFESKIHEVRINEGWYGVSFIGDHSVGHNFHMDFQVFLDMKGHNEAFIFSNGSFSSLYFGLTDLLLTYEGGKFKVNLTFPIGI